MTIRCDDELVEGLRNLLDSRASDATDPTDELLKVVESLSFLIADSDLPLRPTDRFFFDNLLASCALYRDLIHLPNS